MSKKPTRKGEEKSPLVWTPEDAAAATKAGWALFNYDEFDTENGDLRIERVDEPEEGDATLVSDSAAWRLVWKSAASGDAICGKALAIVKVQNEAEYDSIREVGEGFDTSEDASLHQCFNCGRAWEEGSLKEIHDLWGRIAPGEPLPSGECPGCGSLCQPVKPAPTFVVVIRGGLVSFVGTDGPAADVLVLDFDVDNAQEDGLKSYQYVSEEGEPDEPEPCFVTRTSAGYDRREVGLALEAERTPWVRKASQAVRIAVVKKVTTSSGVVRDARD